MVWCREQSDQVFEKCRLTAAFVLRMVTWLRTMLEEMSPAQQKISVALAMESVLSPSLRPHNTVCNVDTYAQKAPTPLLTFQNATPTTWSIFHIKDRTC
jgi:hypothetical protein